MADHQTSPGTTAAHESLRVILVARDVQRKDLINDFLTERRPLFLKQSAILCQHFHQDRNRMFEDVAQMIAQTAFEMILEVLNQPAKLDEFENFEAVLRVRARYAVGAYIRSANHTPLSGMSSVERRRMAMNKTRKRLRQDLGREPTDSEVIEHTNAQIRETIADPQRSGFLVSESDLASSVTMTSADDRPEQADDNPDHIPDAHGASGLHSAEHNRFIDTVALELASHPQADEITKVARHWLSVGLTEEVLTGTQIAEHFDISTGSARAYLRTIKETSGRVLKELNTDD